MEGCSSDFVDKLYTEYSSGVAKITIDNRVSVTKSEWSVKRVQKGRLFKEKDNEFVIFMLRRVNKIQPSQCELEFSWFFSSFFIETKAFKINHNNENWNVSPYSTTKMLISILIVKSNIFPRISWLGTFLAWRYNSRETA